MGVKFTSFDTMTTQNKVAALLNIKNRKSNKKTDYYLALHALLDDNAKVILTAKLVANTFSDQNFHINIAKLSQIEVKEKINHFMKDNIGTTPSRITVKLDDAIQIQAKELQQRQKKYDTIRDWGNKFSSHAIILNTLRSDTQALILNSFPEDEPVEKAYMCFFQPILAPFRELNRSLDSNAATTVVNLNRITNPGQISPSLETLFSQVEHPIYLLTIFSEKRGILFLRDSLSTSSASIMSFNFQQVTSAKTIKEGQLISIEIETPQDLFKLPAMRSHDANNAINYIREKSIEAIEAEEEYIDRDFEKELKKLDMLFKAKALKNSEYIFRKSRLQKMELEKFSDKNIEILLAKRFSNDGASSNFDEQLMKKFTFEKTVMFTDIVGFTSKAAEKQLLDTMTLLAVHDQLLMPIVDNFEGILIKKIGDALMLRFDDAINACKAAKEMQFQLAKFNKKSNEKIFIRIGLNTGTVFVKNEDVFGDAVNVAARMESLAQPGRIFITQATFSKTKDKIECEDIGKHMLKGLKEPCQVYSIIDNSKTSIEMIELANKCMTEIGMKIPNVLQGKKLEPTANELQLMKNSIDQAIQYYKASVKKGMSRNGQLENWFSKYDVKIKPTLDE